MRGNLLRKSNISGRDGHDPIILLVLLGLLWFAGGTVLGAELKAVEVVSRVQAWLDGTHTLAGQFEQVLISSALGAGLEENGRLYIERPGKMRWDYTSPERKVAIIQGDLTWFYIEEDEQMFLGRLDGEIKLLPMLLASIPAGALAGQGRPRAARRLRRSAEAAALRWPVVPRISAGA